MRVVVNLNQCEANALCMGEAPEVFDLNDNDELTLLTEYPDESQRQRVEAAVRQCPRQAISIEEDV
jgi:ferredoxin